MNVFGMTKAPSRGRSEEFPFERERSKSFARERKNFEREHDMYFGTQAFLRETAEFLFDIVARERKVHSVKHLKQAILLTKVNPTFLRGTTGDNYL